MLKENEEAITKNKNEKKKEKIDGIGLKVWYETNAGSNSMILENHEGKVYKKNSDQSLLRVRIKIISWFEWHMYSSFKTTKYSLKSQRETLLNFINDESYHSTILQ